MSWFSSYLEKIRQRPEKTRKRVALSLSALVTLVIIGVWVPWFVASHSALPASGKPSLWAALSNFGQDVGQTFHSAQKDLAALSASSQLSATSSLDAPLNAPPDAFSATSTVSE